MQRPLSWSPRAVCFHLAGRVSCQAIPCRSGESQSVPPPRRAGSALTERTIMILLPCEGREVRLVYLVLSTGRR